MLKPKKAAAVAKLKLRTFPLRFDLLPSNKQQVLSFFQRNLGDVFNHSVWELLQITGSLGKPGLINVMFPEQLKET